MSRSTILLAKDHNLSVRIMRDVNYILKFSVKTSVDLADIIGLLSLHYLRKMIIVQNKLMFRYTTKYIAKQMNINTL